MRASGKVRILLALLLAVSMGGGLSAATPAKGPAPAKEGFAAEGSVFVSTASATGPSAAAAEAKARSAALHGLFAGLGKDGLFAEVFAASPPIGLSFLVLESSREALAYKVLVQLRVDDESIRIVERGPYLAAAVGLLDKADLAADEAEARKAGAAAAETKGDLGDALGQYGMAADASRSALQLISPVEDPSVFSTKGKRTAPVLKKDLASTLGDALAGIERVKKAEAALAADASTAAVNSVADTALATADEAQALLDEANPILSDLSGYGEEKLSPLRDRVSIERRKVGDATAALHRALAALPKDSAGYSRDKVEFADRRLVTAQDSLQKAFSALDREIRDPPASRAARARAIRWAFLHEPREYLSLRGYLPFRLAAGEGGLSAAPFDASMDLEGAFPMGRGGVWVKTQGNFTQDDLDPATSAGSELALAQTFDLGFWGKSLFFAGYGWDWLRRVDNVSFPKPGMLRLGMGGIYEHRAEQERFHRADWLLALSYELPYSASDTQFWKFFNYGFESQFRLGTIALLEAALSERLEERAANNFASLLSWSVGLGLRVPPPFTVGIQYYGDMVMPLDQNGNQGAPSAFEGGHFRFYLQYSI